MASLTIRKLDDAIRDELSGLGVEVMDSAAGASWKLRRQA